LLKALGVDVIMVDPQLSFPDVNVSLMAARRT
jgi:hypothetical protein